MNRTARLQPIVELALLLAGAVSTLPSCATYQDGQNMSASLAGASAGTGGDVPSAGAGGLEQAAGGGGSPATGGAEQSSTGGTVDGAAGALMAGGTSLGGGGASSAGAGGSPSDGGSSTGGASAAGAPGAGGTTGSAGQAGAMGSAGAPVVDQLISQGKTASANSEQTGNLAPAGNDGSMTSRWCAADSAFGYHWQVDLAQSYTLGKIHILWEKSALYQFKVEGSQDSAVWSTLLDETQTTNTSADQTYSVAGGPTARWVRITVTNLPNTTTWASFFEFQVYGH
jgi:hypothetical protein